MNREILKKNLILIKNDSENLANIFYQLLEKESPTLTRLLSAQTQTESKQKQLIYWLKLVFHYLEQGRDFNILLKKMGRKYISFEVNFKHYQIIEDTLLKTVACVLKEQWTREVELAWQDFSKSVVELMLQGAKEKYSLWNSSNGGVLSEVNRLKIEALIRKAKLNNTSVEILTQELLADSYFQKAIHYLGRQKALEILLEFLEQTNRKNI